MAGVIRTVCGDIPPAELGFCHSHEHILLSKCKPFEIDPALCADDPTKSLEELMLYKSAGGRALVDAQPLGCGRMSGGLEDISRKSKINIIASTGFHKMMFYYSDSWIFTLEEKELADLFTSEIETGMFINTDRALPEERIGAKAGVIKTALDTGGLDAQYSKLFSAAAAACVKTGASLIIHVEKDSDPLKLDSFLSDRGVSPKKCIYCHLDRAMPDLRVHKELLSRGCYLEYDTICRGKYHDDEAEIKIITSMLESGFRDSVLLGLDTTNKRLKAYGGTLGLDYIKKSFIPLAMERGVSQRDLNGFMLENPSRAFAIG